jgi:tetratricopeptide (TPR) repeat protein
MAQQATDAADPISNAVVSPDASLFTRQILQSALANVAGSSSPPPWVPDAQALLANVLMNDYLNWWNNAGQNELAAAQNVASHAGDSALANHAKGLIYRAAGQPDHALKAFRAAKISEDRFARAHAQFGNQKAALGRENETQDPLDTALKLNPHHPACGYFFWGKGRAFFQQEDWARAIESLQKSVDELPTVWYNRCYLAAAQDKSPDTATKLKARQTFNDFVDLFGKDTLWRAISSLQNTTGPATVVKARKTVRDFLVQQPLP